MAIKDTSILGLPLEKQLKLFILGCLCHFSARCAAALKKLPVSLDDHLIEIFYHFKHSIKIWHELTEIQIEFSKVKPL